MVWKNPWYDPNKAHHTPEGFRNLEADLHSPGDLQRWRKERKAQGVPFPPQSGYHTFIQQWCQPVDLTGEADAVWWLGHACLMLRINNRYSLIDPALSQRASPLRFYGPKRKTPVPLNISDLPSLACVFISHNHYDHLDAPTIHHILRCFPHVHFVVPLGLRDWFIRQGARNVTQLDWWQSTEQAGLIIHAVPARHWSQRSLWDRNRSLWCGWTIHANNLRLWFAGDSGYSPNLLEIPRRLGAFNFAALPVGAYAPRWFMAGHHMDPQQAISLHRDLGCPRSLPVHWGVFELADESLDSPPRELAQSMIAAGLDENRFRAWKIGERLLINNIDQY